MNINTHDLLVARTLADAKHVWQGDTTITVFMTDDEPGENTFRVLSESWISPSSKDPRDVRVITDWELA